MEQTETKNAKQLQDEYLSLATQFGNKKREFADLKDECAELLAKLQAKWKELHPLLVADHARNQQTPISEETENVSIS